MGFFFKSKCSRFEPDIKKFERTTEKEHSAVVLLQQFCIVIVNMIKQLKHCAGIWEAEHAAEMEACFLFI